MKPTNCTPTTSALVSLLLLLLAAPARISGQVTAENDSIRIHLLAAARDVIQAARFCDLITLDETGRPRSRVMDPFPPDSNFVIWLGTNRASRKVAQIRNDPRVTLQYFAPSDGAYVTLAGTAELVDDPALKETRWKKGWETFYPDMSAYLLIKVTPEWLELVSPAHGIISHPETWTPQSVTF